MTIVSVKAVLMKAGPRNQEVPWSDIFLVKQRTISNTQRKRWT